MKKLIILALATVFLLAACGKNKVDESAAEEYIKKSKETIMLFNEEKFDEMRSMFDATMKDALTVEQLQDVSNIVKESGEFVSFEKESVAKKEQYFVATIATKYKEDNRVYTITLDEQQRIAGFFVK
ncbi:hypothetical protein CSV71_07725 [Sporosarcina sp. P21c]|uniref:DUF3887 domain-containing protein n=1 Tax=unclassified Sporosarcina TaxID=2647733 RepID=UPI000C16F64F|nr:MULTISPECIES: DUF3887 domain-containing protein [unclassified Sporosarcina]PIC66693.1 hypothetical protein CSV78_10945 [Sporosarcina sp. P16a]PIC89828.1 hypothetical protein CSV71_07725 [Sporosarcina sp. P21c]PIC93214.1 hypothetical protein CSV70_06540 [Sporosarcina sp. P25]